MNNKARPRTHIYWVLFIFIALGILASASALFRGSAATPANETLTDVSGPKTYAAGPFNFANGSPVPQVDSGPRCSGANNSASTLPSPCDSNALTVNIPAAYLAVHPNASVKVTMFWTDTGSTASDYDLYVFKGAVGATSGSQGADYQSASGSNPEIAVITPLTGGPQQYTIKIVPYTPTQEIVNVRIELQPGASGGVAVPTVPFGGPDATVPGNPRYLNFYAPAGTSAEASQGEFNIGFNPFTHRIMTMNEGPVWRLTPPEILALAKPECCEALWEDKSSTVTDTGLDPILWTDQKSGRTFASNSTAGANAVYAYTDNDGDLWVPIGGGPPNGGADHETIGTGPFPPSLSALSTPVNKGENTLYCSQDIVGPAFCARSLDLGSTWGPGVPAYTGQSATGCGGLHGHVHIAPNGTIWLPVNQCNGKQGGATSTDAGTTWNEFVVTGSVSQTNGADPSIALDSASKAYYCYVNNEAGGTEGHVHVKTSTDGGTTWTNDFDLGASHGIVNAAHTEAVGGSAGRAACGFIGTNVSGNYQAGSFPGVWYAFIATTYDGGVTWTTVNASPNDPVQSMTGVWQQGGSGQNGDRNLLDFNEITLDDKGRVLYGYSDGCHSAACINGTAPSDLGAFMRVARQSGGKSLLSAFDPVEPAAPKPPCLSGTRDSAASHLTWKIPDNGGSDITGYVILRSTTTGTETVLVANTANTKNTYNDLTANPAVAHYFYTVKAVNSSGTVIGNASNEVDLSVAVAPPLENVCTLPGLTKLTDASGDTSSAAGVITTPAPPGSDLLKLQIAQPFASDGVIKLAFTITTDNGQAVQPTGSAWYVAIKKSDGTYKGVHMAWLPTAPSTPTFESYTPGANNSGGVDGRFVTSGTQKPADASSSYASPFNKVVIVVKASDLGLSPGDIITGFLSGVSQSTDPGAIVGAGATALYDQMPDSLSFAETYTVNNNQVCRTNTCPVAVLSANPTSGNAPLMVNFSGANSSDPDTSAPADSIAFYTFDFGDGSSPVTQSGATISHTYNTAGSPTATLSVTDSRGLLSCNTAQQVITVTAAASPTPTPSPSPTPAALFQFSQAAYPVQEACTAINVTVLRGGLISSAASVDVSSNDATAKQKGDYTLVIAHLVFAPNESQKTFQVLISDDGYSEGTESATLLLQNPINGTLGTPNPAALQILDNTPETTSNPIDVSRTFVGQHYHDFLYRQSDQSGEDFWTNNIESCGADAQCRDIKRVDTSTAFFLSIEFKETGFMVIRAQKAGFGNVKSTPRYSVFLRDQREIAEGVIVGQGSWSQQLETNKQNFLADFVTRSDFVTQFPLGSTASNYVNKLFANSGVTPTTAESNDAVSKYGSGDTAGRAAALRSVIESGSVFNKMYNDAFVLMQYYGYLRRNPDDSPDNNFSGYDFWLNKLNSFSLPGEDMRDDNQAFNRARRAEMVKAFIVSSEYRERFFGAPSGNQFAPPEDGQITRLKDFFGATVRYLAGHSPV